MSRSQPYRSRIPTHIIQLLDVASRVTLFLVDQRGPLSYTFKDRLDNKYKTSIGPQLQCSCSPGRNDHCMHTAYVFLKVFRVSVDNPIIWQAAYVDSELSDLLSWKHTVAEVRRPRPAFQALNVEYQSELPSELLKKREKPASLITVLCDRMKLQADSVCPICQDIMTDDMCLSYCKVKCGNNFHLECLKVWARHRSQQQSRVNCPMCRSTFPFTVLSQLQREEKEWAVKQSEKIKIEFNCSSCGVKNIPNNPHKCVLCTNFELCQVCYSARKHIKHPFIRRDPDGRWRGADERRQEELKLKDFIHSKRKETYNDQILKKLRKIDEDPSKLIDFVAAAYPYVSRYITEKIDPLKKMDFDPSDIRCFKCNGTRMLFLRRLACGHFIDHECLKACIANQKYYCQEDGSLFLKGYENLRQRQKEIERKKNHEMINLTPIQFDPSPLERESNNVIQDDYNFVREPEEDSNLTELLSGRNSRNSEHTGNRVGHRFTSNIIREARNTSREPSQEVRQVQLSNLRQKALITRLVPKSRQRLQRPNIPRPTDIRIRNVNPSMVRNRNEAVQSTKKYDKSQKKGRRQNMGLVIEALIGHKLK